VRLAAIGHVSRDDLPDGPHRLGGTALYAAATAARLGVEAALVTRVGPNERDELTRVCSTLGIDLRALDSLITTTFAFRWDPDGTRTLRLKARAKAIAATDVPPDLRDADATVLGSIAQEISRDLVATRTSRVTVLAAQGLLRAWDAEGIVRATAWPDAPSAIHGLSCVVVSEEDAAGDRDAPREWSRVAPVALTLAERGVSLYERGRAVAEVPAFQPARIVDATGAGDAFAAGLAVALAEGVPMPDACRFANAVASFALEGDGITGLASRKAVERRIAG
jgi:sugar/nucleoside kinase (ribokinase family)